MTSPAARSPRRLVRHAVVLAVAAMLAGCTSQSPPDQLPGAPDDAAQLPAPPGSPAVGGESVPLLRARVDSLEARARALATTAGCATAEQCAAAPLGAKPCGGPRTYLPYCRATTDSAALFATLDALQAAERAYNDAAGLMSDCAVVMPPELALEGNSCAVRAEARPGGGE